MAIKSVLICDDDEILVSIVRVVMTKKNFKVFTANNGAAALKQILSIKPQLIFLDLDMPEKNGFEVLEGIKGADIGRNYKIVISGHEDKASRDKALALGADDVWVKPFNAAKLLGEVESLVQQGRI